MRIGLIGLGSIGERHAKNIRSLYPGAELSILTKRMRWSGAQNVTLARSHKEFFADPCDVYFVTNETDKHVKTILECLERKPRGIFVEKPLSFDHASAVRLRDALKRTRTAFMLGYCLQYFEPLLQIKKLVNSGTIGSPLYMRVSAGQDLRTWRTGTRRSNYAAGVKGGVVLDLIHEMNYPAWLLNDELEFRAGYSGKLSSLAIQTEDLAEGLFVSRKRGVFVSTHVDYLQNPGRRYCEVAGSKGTLVWEWPLGGKRHTITISGAHPQRRVLTVETNDMYVREIKAFMAHVRAKNHYNGLEEALADLKLADALKRS